MSPFSKDIVSEKTLILWLVISSVTTGLCILAGGVVVWLIFDCWPIGSIFQKAGSCLNKVQPPALQFLPVVIGVILGTILTIKNTRQGQR